MITEPTLYLRCRPGDVAPLVLLSGDPARVDRAAAMLDTHRKVSANREFLVTTGTYRDYEVTIASGGIGAPSTAIAIEELAQLGVRAIVRIGTMMGVRAELGTVVLSAGAARFEGLSQRYLPLAYPAIPHFPLVRTLAMAAQHHDLPTYTGLTATYDAFYPDMAPSLTGSESLDLTLPMKAGVQSMDMETALVFTLGMTLGIATASMCLVTVRAEPHLRLDGNNRAELDDRLVQAALDGLCDFSDTL